LSYFTLIYQTLALFHFQTVWLSQLSLFYLEVVNWRKYLCIIFRFFTNLLSMNRFSMSKSSEFLKRKVIGIHDTTFCFFCENRWVAFFIIIFFFINFYWWRFLFVFPNVADKIIFSFGLYRLPFHLLFRIATTGFYFFIHFMFFLSDSVIK